MAIIEQGILGAFRGKCGNVIGYIRNGVACVRSMPSHYYDRRSAAQLRNRGRFTMVMKMMSVVRPAVTKGFNQFASTMTEMNVATRVNYYSLVKEGTSGLEYDYAGLVLSRGRVEGLSGVMMNRVGWSLNLVWNGNGVLGGADDKVSIVLLNADRMEMRMFCDVALRRSGSASLLIPQGWNGEEVHCYLMVGRGSDWSESCHVGRFVAGVSLAMTDWSAVGIDTEFNINRREVDFSSDQSAVKVLSDLGSVGGKDVEKEERSGPGGIDYGPESS